MSESDPHLYKIVWNTRRLLSLIEKSVEANLPSGMTVRTRAALEALIEGALTVPAIGCKLHIKRQYTQLIVNEAVEAGFAVIKPNPSHARSSLIQLTDEGMQTITAVRKQEGRILKSIAADLGADEIKTASKVMATLLDGFASQDTGELL